MQSHSLCTLAEAHPLGGFLACKLLYMLTQKVNDLALSEIGVFDQKAIVGSPSPKTWELPKEGLSLDFFYKVVTNSHLMESYNESIGMLLSAACQKFEADTALVLKPVSNAVMEVQAFSGGSERFYVGQHISAAEFLCHRALDEDETLFIRDVAYSGNEILSIAYNGANIGSYIGAPLKPHFLPAGVLCMFSSAPHKGAFGEEERKVLEQLVSGVAYLADLQKTLAQRKSSDSSMFANGSISTLDEYLEKAHIPELYGVPGRVVEVLKTRIGKSPLSIGQVAEELNLSKRTLQRRLQQQCVNFAELRDQVRFHYSIDYLVKKQVSIDSISVSLDFSDRTSFTNAFKRWTGLSPSTFRKLFRDFV